MICRPSALLLAATMFLAAMSARAQEAVDVEALRQRATVRWERVPRRVLAFYYPWYGTPEFSGRWIHWSGVDLDAKRIASSTHFPLLGPYDSLDPEVIEQHMKWAAEAGIDGFIASWWRPGDRTDRAMPLLLKAAENHGLFLSAYIETVPEGRPDRAAEIVLYLLNRYADSPAWLTVNDRPVLFVYVRAVNQIGLSGWLSVLKRVNVAYPRGVVLIGDQISQQAARVFDGIHTYNITAHTAGKTVEEIEQWASEVFPRQVRVAGPGRIACITVIPGYDDSKLGRPKPRPITDRHGGETYRTLWRQAIAADPDWILITSWNEWHEGSEIEPSLEHGFRELRTTASFAPVFRRRPPRQPVTQKTSMETVYRRLGEALRGVTVGVLPGADSEALWLLAEAGVSLRALSWEDIASGAVRPEAVPYLLYAGGEVYRATVRQPNDVLRGLQEYVKSGGTLVVLPDGPMPFHYDRRMDRRHAVNHSRLLGLPLRVAWERPPTAVHFEVRLPDALPHLPERLPFPKEGDVRWRPVVPSEERSATPLLELVDNAGQSHGWGAAVLRNGKGRIAYVWFGLLRGEYGPLLQTDLWTWLEQQRRQQKAAP